MDCKEYYSREKTLELRDIYIPYVALHLIVSREISIEFYFAKLLNEPKVITRWGACSAGSCDTAGAAASGR